MAKARLYKAPPSKEDVFTFLAAVDHDSLLAAMAPRHVQGIRDPDVDVACKRVYDFLRSWAEGRVPELAE